MTQIAMVDVQPKKTMDEAILDLIQFWLIKEWVFSLIKNYMQMQIKLMRKI